MDIGCAHPITNKTQNNVVYIPDNGYIVEYGYPAGNNHYAVILLCGSPLKFRACLKNDSTPKKQLFFRTIPLVKKTE